MASLCSPSPLLSCFACCPPIRPRNYDHLDHEAILKREFRANRLDYLRNGPMFRPIVGFSCWALGFLDEEGRRAGCLLHPSRNGGQDLRFLIDYGEKCARESCRAAKAFERLSAEVQDFWISLVGDFDSFLFSSRRTNPLFHILLWGPPVLERLHREAMDENWSVRELLRRRTFITDPAWNPIAHRFLFRLALESDAPKGHTCRVDETLCRILQDRIHNHSAARPPSREESAVFTHLLPFEGDLLDFLRLDLGWEFAGYGAVRQLEAVIMEMAGLLFRT